MLYTALTVNRVRICICMGVKLKIALKWVPHNTHTHIHIYRIYAAAHMRHKTQNSKHKRESATATRLHGSRELSTLATLCCLLSSTIHERRGYSSHNAACFTDVGISESAGYSLYRCNAACFTNRGRSVYAGYTLLVKQQ